MEQMRSATVVIFKLERHPQLGARNTIDRFELDEAAHEKPPHK